MDGRRDVKHQPLAPMKTQVQRRLHSIAPPRYPHKLRPGGSKRERAERMLQRWERSSSVALGCSSTNTTRRIQKSGTASFKPRHCSLQTADRIGKKGW
ncbi:hypothetical protein K443DRAFT_682772 [Laccaria amethystina LaAM-08-1]|uniref:Uncharacterized protein n=1 Tax=Laccaria amethystina LaAM-08-1 TaxID=1095629 RepID=A0A0C9XHV8_9AGAR|nr:hypothetical protein K443DRAFT_682772 [Laccaria amethystina LaAM-08-1]